MKHMIAPLLLAFILLGCSAEADLPGSPCDLKPDPGPCKARIEKFFYNEKTNSCEVFIWGGCEGSVPFNTLSDCMNTCAPKQAEDEPQCEFEGSFYEIGDSWPVDCNTCTCSRTDLSSSPAIVCTEMACGNELVTIEEAGEEYPYTVTLKLGESKSIPGGSIAFTEITQEDDQTPERVFLQVKQDESPSQMLFIDIPKEPEKPIDTNIYGLYLQLKPLKTDPEDYKIELLIDKNANIEGDE